MAQTAEVVIPASQSDLSIGGGLEQTSQGASFYQPNSSGINVLQVSRTFLSFLEHLVTQSGQMRRSLVLQAHVNRRVMWTSFGSGIIHVCTEVFKCIFSLSELWPAEWKHSRELLASEPTPHALIQFYFFQAVALCRPYLAYLLTGSPQPAPAGPGSAASPSAPHTFLELPPSPVPTTPLHLPVAARGGDAAGWDVPPHCRVHRQHPGNEPLQCQLPDDDG